MSHKEHQVAAGIISKDVDDERLRKYASKYETVVKQFDELMGVMTNSSSVPKWRRIPSKRRRSASGENGAASSRQPDSNIEALLKTVTKSLHELRANPTDSE